MQRSQSSHRRTYVILIGAIVLVVLLLLSFLYIIKARNQSGRFPAKTSINGIDVSGMTATRAKNELANKAEEYTLTITERQGTETITGEQIGLTFVDNGDVDRLIKGFNPYKWFFDGLTQKDLTASTDTVLDSTLAEQTVRALNCFTNYTPAQNAQIVDDGTQFTVQEAVQGTELNTEDAVQAILTALNAGDTAIDLDAQGLYKQTESADTAELQAQADLLNGYLAADLTMDFGDDRIIHINAKTIREWMTTDENGVMDLDYDKVFEFVKTKIAYKVDTFGLKHTIKTHSGYTITLSGGDYGWCLARGDTTDTIIAAVKAGQTGTLEPSWQYKGKNLGYDDIGGTYIEVSISEQTMWCYKDGQQIVETPVVTGNINKGNGTPYGSVWAIDAMKKDATLGTIETMGYASPVNFWMPFNGNVGIHDADGWRSKYGGEIYKTNGSHGCVNTPYDACKTIYENVSIGTAVVVYDLSDESTVIVSKPGEYQTPSSDADWDWDE